MPSPYFTTSASPPSSPLTTLSSSSSSPTSSLIMIHPLSSQSQMPQISVSFSLCFKPVTVSTGVCNVVGGGQRSISPLPARAVLGRVEGFNNREARFATQAQSGWRLAPGSAAGRKRFTLHASWFSTSQIATSVFSMGTAAVLPFYALMVFVPKANLTKKTMESSFPYVALGLVYAYLLHLSWTPDSIRLMFSGQYMLPELSGITKMFASEMTLASAWIHLLVVDLFAARQIFHDGLESQVETRHSVSLCLFCCPLGIFTHLITKALTRRAANKTPSIH